MLRKQCTNEGRVGWQYGVFASGNKQWRNRVRPARWFFGSAKRKENVGGWRFRQRVWNVCFLSREVPELVDVEGSTGLLLFRTQ